MSDWHIFTKEGETLARFSDDDVNTKAVLFIHDSRRGTEEAYWGIDVPGVGNVTLGRIVPEDGA
jgi:hypothetical protein